MFDYISLMELGSFYGSLYQGAGNLAEYILTGQTAGKIVAIDVISENETNGLGDKAIPVVIQSILEAQSTDVDGVSGATVSSDAVKEAVNKALEEAK